MEATPNASASAYCDIMAECETMADEILDFPDGQRKYPGGIRNALALPPGIGQGSLDALLPFAVAKKKTLSRMLARLNGPVPGQAPPILAAAVAVATPSLPTTTTTAPLPTTTAPLPRNTWPAEQYFMTRSPELPYPRLPEALAKARQIKPKGEAAQTDPVLFWNCCHQEIVFKGRPLCNAELGALFEDQCKALSFSPTVGHDTWLRKHLDLLLVLYKAAEVRHRTCGGSDKNAMKVLETAWRL